MYLADRDIRAVLPEMQLETPNAGHPFDADKQIQPCSIDLRVSNVFWRPSKRRQLLRWMAVGPARAIDLRRSGTKSVDPLRDWSRLVLQEGEAVALKPGGIVMGRIYERFRIPEGYAGKIEGRSSFARLGLSVHCTGDFINPGWQGFMPLQFVNSGPHTLRLTPYLDICQLMLVRLSSQSERTYGDEELRSKYVNDDGGPSLWWRDDRVRALQSRLGERHVGGQLQEDLLRQARSSSGDILGRLDHFVQDSPVGELENSTDVLDDFARSERRRKVTDDAATWTAGVAVPALASALFVAWSAWHVLVLILTLVSVPLAFRGYVRRAGGYLLPSDVQKSRQRPPEAP